MGAKDSKLSFISYEDAAKRVSESELRRIREAFKRCAGSTSSTLSLEAFVHEVLCDGVPYEVADWLYQACGGTKRGITFKDLFCGVVVLTKGNIEEKIKFLWTLYTNNQNDNGTHIYKKDFAHALNVERTSLPVAETHRTVEILTSLFGANEKVTFEQFRSWLLIHNDATVLSKWLLFDRHNVVQDLDTPTFYQSLSGVTHLDEREIMELEKCFWSLRAAAGGALRVGGAGGVDTLLAPALGGAAAGLARALDDNCDAQVDFKELCCGLSAACRGPVTERLKFCFKIFDLDRDGLLNKRELIDMVGILCTVANEAMRNQGSRSSTPSTEDSESERGFDPEVILLNLRDKLVTITKEGRKPVFQLGPIDGNEISPAYQDVTKEETEEDDSIIGSSMCLSAEEFLIWSVESAEPLLTPFLELTFEACHVVLGLRPQCPHQERDIVLGWMRRAAGRGLAPGQLWYLVAADWWAAWLRHGAAPRACCRRAARLPDDDSLTTASTESMGSLLWRAETTSLGSAGGSSGVGSGGGGGGGSARAAHPGPVDNARLLAGGAARAPALTGEGGLLRRDVTLAQHRDFELLPDELWRALAQWYGAPHPLPRQVIRPPGGDVELELYPLQLDILRHAPNAQRTGPPERQLAYTAAFSRLATVKQVTEFLCGALGLARERVRLWLLRGEPGAAAEQLLLDDERPTLAELHPHSNARARLLLELRNADLTWPEEITALSLAGAGRAAERRETLAAPELAGATGLHNLGNTCFMNAALQAVWNTAALTRYFTADMHLREVNAANPLGTRGELALRFGELCKEVWSGGLRSVAPLRVRSCVARWARALAGGGQHDAQELLAWLLDALHEDLNRARPPAVAPTPVPLSAPHPTPAPAPAPLPDQVAAAEAWEQFSLRNSSVMTELFYGQLKSQVRCTCGRESVRFDTFNMLSLPLPLEAHVRAEVKVVRQDGSVPVRYGVRVSSDGTFAELRRVLAELCGLPADSLVLVEGGGSLAGREVAARAPVPAGARLLAYEAPSESDADSDSDTHTDQDAPANHDVHTDQNAHAHRDAHSDQDVQTDHDARSDHVHAEHFAPRRYHSLDAEASAGAAAGTEAAAEAEAGAAQVSARASSLCMPALFCFKRSRSESVMYHDGWGAVGPGGPGGARAAFGSSPADMQRAHLAVRGHTPLPALHPAPSRSPRFIFAVHRKQVGAEAYFVPWQRSRPAAFGAPLLVALRRGDSGRRLHARVWRQLARLLTPRPAPRAHNHAADCDDSLGYEFPFRLRVVDARGAWCALCAWPALCRGCLLPACDRALVCDARDVETGTEADAEVEAGAVRRLVRERLAGALLAVDWDPTALHLRYQPAEEQACVEHASVAESLAAAARPVDLASCLRAFTGEERLEQHYQCAACRAARPATKKLQLWRLPPVLIIHLKRFQYVNNKWVKSQKVVDFPYQDFDPTPYLASVPQETILRHNELKSLCDRRSSELLDLVETESEPEEAPEESRRSKVARRRRESPAGGRKRLESSSLTAAPVQDDNLVDYHQHRLEPERDPFDLKYNLYAVVAHSGELSGGHYVAYARHGSGAWLCYNDSACRVLPAPTLDPAAAYLLFYERRGLRASAYLPPAGGSPPPPAPAAAVPGCALT